MKDKKETIVIIILSIIIISLAVLLLVVNNKGSNKVCNTISKEEHYKKMKTEMESYYKIINKIYFSSDTNPISKLKLHLNDIKKYGFPMDNFINYDSKEKCDLNESYAMVEYDEINNDYKIEVFYLCGNDTNLK